MRRDQRFQKWCKWLNTIEEDVSRLYFARDVFTKILDIADNNERIDKKSLFFPFFNKIYADSVVMGIRRQLKKDKDSISLVKLLYELSEHPELVTRSDFYELYQTARSPLHHAEKIFNRFCEPNAVHINKTSVEDDIKELKELCKIAEEHADRRIAHWDKRPPAAELNLEDMYISVDMLGKLVQRYYLLFFATEVKLHPIPQYPIYHIFEEPWLSSDSQKKIL